MAPEKTRTQARGGAGRVSGFTLAEILIALALIAILAAVLLPTVAGQILKGDAARVMQDLEAVRSGADQFLADVHRYPGRYAHLSNSIVNTETDINGSTYPNGLVSKWSGPYVTRDTTEDGTVLTGFGGEIQNTFTKTLNTNGVNYLTILIVGIAQPDFERIDTQLDGSVGATTGQLRWAAGGGDTVKFLATPIQ